MQKVVFCSSWKFVKLLELATCVVLRAATYLTRDIRAPNSSPSASPRPQILFQAGKECGPFRELWAWLPALPGDLAPGISMLLPTQDWAGCLHSHAFYCWH
jgi:hypothetical protein